MPRIKQTIFEPKPSGSFVSLTPSSFETNPPTPTTSNDDEDVTTIPPPEKIPRPPNAFILFRADMSREYPKKGSREYGLMWRNASPSVRARYERLAAEKKKEHEIKYPDYKYCPVRKPKTTGKDAKSTGKDAKTTTGNDVKTTGKDEKTTTGKEAKTTGKGKSRATDSEPSPASSTVSIAQTVDAISDQIPELEQSYDYGQAISELVSLSTRLAPVSSVAHGLLATLSLPERVRYSSMP
jgi:hypothetical protein